MTAGKHREPEFYTPRHERAAGPVRPGTIAIRVPVPPQLAACLRVLASHSGTRHRNAAAERRLVLALHLLCICGGFVATLMVFGAGTAGITAAALANGGPATQELLGFFARLR